MTKLLNPDVTLVVPLRDEELSVEALLRSIARQSRPPDRVVFVDAGSRDRTCAILMNACAEHPGWSVRLAGPATPGRARNVGIEAADTEWVALTDAGVDLDRFWLERLVRVVRADPAVEVVWGHYEAARDGWFTECASLAYISPPRRDRVGPVRPCSVASCMLQRRVWELAGRFPDLRAAEDGIFMRRLVELGVRTAIAPEALARWHLEDGFLSTFRRFRVYSRVNALAGEQRDWHYGVARIHAGSLLFLALALVHTRRWALIPLAGAGLRVTKSIWRGREGRGVAWAANPARVFTVGTILATADAATFAGWLDAARQRRNRG